MKINDLKALARLDPACAQHLTPPMARELLEDIEQAFHNATAYVGEVGKESRITKLRKYILEYRVVTLDDCFSIINDVEAWSAKDAVTQSSIEVRRKILDELDRRSAKRVISSDLVSIKPAPRS